MTIETIPAQLSEAIHGILAIKLADSAFRSALFVHREWRDRAPGIRFYTREIKAAVALTMTWIGLDLVVWAIWWLLHMRNHGGDVPFPAGPWMVVCGTAMASWGSVCWARSTARDGDRCHSWVVVTLAAIAFGVYFAL